MRYSCLHTHTTFCDGYDTVERFCETAYQKGLESIGFSAHAPLRNTGLQSDWHLREDRLGAYIDEVTAARSRWEGAVTVFLGLEIDYIPGLMSPKDSFFHGLGLDYRIGSVHYLIPPKGAPFTVDSSAAEFEQGLQEGFDGDIGALVSAYWDAVASMIQDGSFTILGHADLIRKNNQQNRWFSPDDSFYVNRLAPIAAALGAAHIVAEVNTGGMIRYNLPEPYPSRAFLRRLRENRVPVVITTDAHRAEHLGGHYDTAREILAQAGYTETVLFNGASWETVSLP